LFGRNRYAGVGHGRESRRRCLNDGGNARRVAVTTVVVSDEIVASRRLLRVTFVNVLVVPDVLHCLWVGFVLAMRSSRTPGKLEWQQQREEQCDEPRHRAIISVRDSGQPRVCVDRGGGAPTALVQY